MKQFVAASVLLAAFSLSAMSPAAAQGLPPLGGPYPPTFTKTLSNNTPLVFGMSADEATFALGVPLNYVRGRPGDETFLAFRDYGGSGLFPNRHRLYLQFRKGKLAGWKGDWGHNWMWQ
ncbi:MAG: hypothetical protein GY844_22915 [Bradyrhizobium sp.]|nr:hypothetical protein [Bradyrhizobium sp.]